MVDDHLQDEHLFSISALSPWFADICNYLVVEKFLLNLSSKEKRNIIKKSTPFTWIGGNLFKMGLGQIIRICVMEEKVFEILSACHDGLCGSHFLAKRKTFKAMQACYY